MPNQLRRLLNYGRPHRLWPFADVKRSGLYVSVALVRPFVEPICKLLRSEDHGESFCEIADFYSMDKRNTTTGQPFVAVDGTILVPTWNAGFYTRGTTWLAIYRSDDNGFSWTKVFEDSKGTYGKHFFQSPKGGLYLGAGLNGGGSEGRVSSRPRKSYLLKSDDIGKTWEQILHVDYPTALYSGATPDSETVLVAAREKKSLFLSENEGETWKEIRLGNVARSISYVDELGKLVVSSNSAIFLSSDAKNWTRLNTPLKGLILRYPTWYNNRLYMSSVGWHNYVVSTTLKNWYLSFDLTKATHNSLGARMALLDDYLFVGDEAGGTLHRLKLPFASEETIGRAQVLKGNARYLEQLLKYAVHRIF